MLSFKPTRGAAPRRGRMVRGVAVAAISALAAVLAIHAGPAPAGPTTFPPQFLIAPFNRVAQFKVAGAAAEIVTATKDGQTLIYTDAVGGQVGFVDVSDPAHPNEFANLNVEGEPTSATVTQDGMYALIVVHGAPDRLLVVRLSDRTVARSITLGGQPDSIAVSADGKYAAVVIENERDESVNGGAMPQGPAGFLTIVDTVGTPDAWTTRNVTLTNLSPRFPTDPEPEFVDINANNIAAVTLQENNHIVLVDLANGSIVNHFTAGTVTHAADVKNDSNVSFTNAITNARREPDAIGWLPGGRLAIANEGDYNVDLSSGQFVGGRNYTVFGTDGSVVYDAGASLEDEMARHGYYDDARSTSKGAEVEGIEVGTYGGTPYLFVGMERGRSVAVYSIVDERRPQFVQLLPVGDRPEGLLAVPGRGLFVSANENDGTLSIFQFSKPGHPDFPSVYSPVGIPWCGLSGLAGDTNTLYAIPDSVRRPSRIWKLELSGNRAAVVDETLLTKNYDLEGITINPRGGLWLVSEGAGNAGGSGVTKNLLIRVSPAFKVVQEVELPASVNAQQRSNGFEGVATSSDGSQVYVAFQRPWGNDPTNTHVKIGRYTVATGEWRFYHYPLDVLDPSFNEGLSEIVRIDDTTFAVIERDNKLGAAAVSKKIYAFSIAGLTPQPDGAALPVVKKVLLRDTLHQDGFSLEKQEGLTLLRSGEFVLVNDNDGFGDTRLLRLRGLLDRLK